MSETWRTAGLSAGLSVGLHKKTANLVFSVEFFYFILFYLVLFYFINEHDGNRIRQHNVSNSNHSHEQLKNNLIYENNCFGSK